jgi:DNA-binding transcriptional LysR family regulator
MDFRGLDLNLLVALDVLLEEKNLTRAGIRIHLSQSAVSGVLARLRAFFADELLSQVGHKMVLTPLAEDLIVPIRDLLLQAQIVVDRTPEFIPEKSKRRIRIILSDYIETVLLSRVAQRLEREAPLVRLDLMPLFDSAYKLLEQGKAEFLIVPESELSALHPSEILFEDEYVCVLWVENPLVGKTISLDQYLGMGHVGICFGEQRYKSWDEVYLRNHGYLRRVEMISTSFSLMPQMLIGSRRIATMHRRLANYFTQYLPLRIVNLPIQMPPLIEKLQWHKSRDQDPGYRWFRSVLQQEAAEINPAMLETTHNVKEPLHKSTSCTLIG